MPRSGPGFSPVPGHRAQARSAHARGRGTAPADRRRGQHEMHEGRAEDEGRKRQQAQRAERQGATHAEQQGDQHEGDQRIQEIGDDAARKDAVIERRVAQPFRLAPLKAGRIESGASARPRAGSKENQRGFPLAQVKLTAGSRHSAIWPGETHLQVGVWVSNPSRCRAVGSRAARIDDALRRGSDSRARFPAARWARRVPRPPVRPRRVPPGRVPPGRMPER